MERMIKVDHFCGNKEMELRSEKVRYKVITIIQMEYEASESYYRRKNNAVLLCD